MFFLSGACALVYEVAWMRMLTLVFGATAFATSPVDVMLQWKWMGMRLATCLSVMLVPTALMGMTFPLVCKIYTRNVGRVGTALGNVYSVNTIGGTTV